jgi:DNA-binding transcriptional ArsR family regulator
MAFPRYDLFPPEDQKLSAGLRDFSHPVRKHILLDLKKGKMSVSDMIRLYRLSRMSIYQHLALLRKSGLVHFEEVSPHTFYWRNEQQINALRDLLKRFLDEL